jgi:hypothetical protein
VKDTAETTRILGVNCIIVHDVVGPAGRGLPSKDGDDEDEETDQRQERSDVGSRCARPSPI